MPTDNGLRQGETVYCSYINDDGQPNSGFFILINKTNTFVEIKSSTNVMIIPMSRILKIKQKVQEVR